MDRLLSMRVFRRVVDEGGFAAAARALDLSPAVVTRLVADLETHLGTRLLQRTTRHVAVTDAGAAYVQRLRTILSEIDEAEASVSEHTHELAGTLHIWAPPVLATYLLGPLIGGFRRLHPRIRFEVTADPLATPAIEGHDITLLATEEGFDADIVARKLVDMQVVLVASPDYLARMGMPQQPQDLSRHECLRLRRPGLHPQVWRLRRPGAQGDEVVDVPVDPVLWTNHNETVVRAALDGAGIASTTQAIAAHALSRGELVRVLPGWIAGRVSIYAALPSRQFMPQRVQAFLDYLTAQTREAVLDLQARGFPV